MCVYVYALVFQIKAQTLEREAKECRMRTEEWYILLFITV